MLDLCYEEDSTADVDMNVVRSSCGGIIEIQGCAEGAPFPRKVLDEMVDLAENGIEELFVKQREALGI